MPKKIRQYFEIELKNISTYLEYGAGGSTVLAAKSGVQNIISIESDLYFLEKVVKKIDSLKLNINLKILHGDVGLTKELGYPVTDSEWKNFHNYSLGPWLFCKNTQLNPGLVLIDGRFRVSSFLATLLFARVGCRILFDDYFDRLCYHSVENYCKVTYRIERAGIFLVPDNLPRDEIWIALLNSISDPR